MLYEWQGYGQGHSQSTWPGHFTVRIIYVEYCARLRTGKVYKSCVLQFCSVCTILHVVYAYLILLNICVCLGHPLQTVSSKYHTLSKMLFWD